MVSQLPVFQGTLMSLDERQARYMLAVGDFIRRRQDELSQGDSIWHYLQVTDHGGPEEVMCSAAFPAHGHRIEVMLTVAMARGLGVHLNDMALLGMYPAQQDDGGLESAPLCGCKIDERAIRRHVRSIPPIPEAALEAVEMALHPTTTGSLPPLTLE